MTESNSYAKAVWSPALLLSSQSKARALPVKGADKQCHMSILVLGTCCIVAGEIVADQRFHMSILVLLCVGDLLHKLAIVGKQLCFSIIRRFFQSIN